MAYSGLREHAEARRKQLVLERAAKARERMKDQDSGAMNEGGVVQCQDPDVTVTELSGAKSPAVSDRLKQPPVGTGKHVVYSAKLPDRLSSVNYTQQY